MVALPLLGEVRWDGFSIDEEAERDVFDEHLALRRGGWSESRWRCWLQLLRLEIATRSQWWAFLVKYANARWGGDVGGHTRIQEQLSRCFYLEEMARRKHWNWTMRANGYGIDADSWWQRYRRHYRLHLGRESCDLESDVTVDSDSTDTLSAETLRLGDGS